MRVLVCGARGKMGKEVVNAVRATEEMELVGGVDTAKGQVDGIELYDDLAEAIRQTKPDVVVDFTRPDVVLKHIKICYDFNVRVVVGTTGLSEVEIQKLKEEAKKDDWAALIAPNFAIGAVLMMKFASKAARFFPKVEIIEYHHDQKKDAPSGTAIKTAEMILEARRGESELPKHEEWEKIPGARGGKLEDINIHSIRLPGYVAHQEVIFGLPGQSLIIRHDSTNRESFMPGVILAIRKIHELKGVIYGLEHILFQD